MLRLCVGWAEKQKAPYPQLSQLFCLWNSDSLCQRAWGRFPLNAADRSPGGRCLCSRQTEPGRRVQGARSCRSPPPGGAMGRGAARGAPTGPAPAAPSPPRRAAPGPGRSTQPPATARRHRQPRVGPPGEGGAGRELPPPRLSVSRTRPSPPPPAAAVRWNDVFADVLGRKIISVCVYIYIPDFRLDLKCICKVSGIEGSWLYLELRDNKILWILMFHEVSRCKKISVVGKY